MLLALQVTSVASKSALLLIDVQDCFLEKDTTTGKVGSLQVPASHIIPVINKIRAQKECLFDFVVRSQDFHPKNHISFGSTHGLAAFAHTTKGGLPIMCIKPTSGNTKDAACCPTMFVNSSAVNCATQLCPPTGWDYSINNSAFVANNPACSTCKSDPGSCFADTQLMWTDHCLQDGDSTFPPNLTTKKTDVIVQKGGNVYVDAYSAFYDNSGNLKTSLDAELQAKKIDTLYVAGIATDVCVKWTVRDALSSKTGNYTVKVISDASAGLALGTTPTQLHEDALKWMDTQGASLVTSTDMLAMKCPGATTITTTGNVTTTGVSAAVSATCNMCAIGAMWLAVMAFAVIIQIACVH